MFKAKQKKFIEYLALALLHYCSFLLLDKFKLWKFDKAVSKLLLKKIPIAFVNMQLDC